MAWKERWSRPASQELAATKPRRKRNSDYKLSGRRKVASRRQSVSGVTQNIIMKKYTLIMVALMAVTACVLGSPQRKKISVKAPSPFENYGCQCDNYTWQDTYGKIQV